MKTLLSKLFNSNKKNEIPYNFLEIKSSELNDYSAGMYDIMARKIDGFLIRDVFTEDEVKNIVEVFEKLPDSKKTVIEGSMSSYPSVFSLVKGFNEEWTEKMKEQQRQWLETVNEIKEEFSFDYVDRLREVMRKVSGESDVKMAQGIDGVGVYSPTSIRKIFSGKEAMNLHCGRMFHGLLPEFYKHLREIADIENQMSYFIMLQPCDVGGELMLYDVEWNEAEKKTGETELESKKGKKIDISDRSKVAQQPLKPGRGDMILFAGSSIWHRVERGTTDRMTLGGFIAKSNTEDAFYYWS